VLCLLRKKERKKERTLINVDKRWNVGTQTRDTNVPSEVNTDPKKNMHTGFDKQNCQSTRFSNHDDSLSFSPSILLDELVRIPKQLAPPSTKLHFRRDIAVM